MAMEVRTEAAARRWGNLACTSSLSFTRPAEAASHGQRTGVYYIF
ncbi:MAG: hypothetical protein OJF49_003891 [Ktedonobacterales bacterium]|nr:MAG: hypothetical protein OJF49_003891 [Ktedonobacterales bacterium]